MIKKYRVSVLCEDYFFANDPTEANKHAQHTIQGVNLHNFEMNVQEIKEVEMNKK